jgi:two-component system cell cycle response regulator
METYVPIYEHGVAVGVFEIYHNISALKRTFHRMLREERRMLVPVIILLLTASLTGSWLAYKSMTELRKTRDRFEQLSVTDTLTGLLNRRGFSTLVEKQLSFLRRCGKGAVLLYIDLDGFKHINDTFGHSAGDQALIETAEILVNTLRISDVIGRIGGDEFAALVVKNENPDHENLVNQRLLESLARWNSQSGAGYTLSFSIGMLEFTADSPGNIEELMNLADKNMYLEKQRKKSSRSAS